MSCCSLVSLGRNTNPVPYFPFSGTGIPCNRMNSWGICSIMPAPSPVLSRVSAPRCSIFSNTRNAWSTSSWLLPPCMFTTIPTPHASCSYCGLYSPFCLHFIIESLLNLTILSILGAKIIQKVTNSIRFSTIILLKIAHKYHFETKYTKIATK